MLFTACFEDIFRTLNWKHVAVRVTGEFLSNLRLVDDVSLFSHSGGRIAQHAYHSGQTEKNHGHKNNLQNLREKSITSGQHSGTRYVARPWKW